MWSKNISIRNQSFHANKRTKTTSDQEQPSCPFYKDLGLAKVLVKDGTSREISMDDESLPLHFYNTENGSTLTVVNPFISLNIVNILYENKHPVWEQTSRQVYQFMHLLMQQD